jgi:hypothetical protein
MPGVWEAGRVTDENPWLRKAAEAYEKAARQSLNAGDRAKATEQWTNAAAQYLKLRDFEKSVECLKAAGLLGERAVELARLFDGEAVLRVLHDAGLREEAALVHLHVQNRMPEPPGVAAFEACYGLGADLPASEKARALRALKGACLAASWTGDDARLQRAADRALGRLSPDGKEGPVREGRDRWSDTFDFKRKVEPAQEARAGEGLDRLRFLLVKVVASGELRLLGELASTIAPRPDRLDLQDPFHVRLLVPIYLYRGIGVGAALDLMKVVRPLGPYAELYTALFQGIESGHADDALAAFSSAVAKGADGPDPGKALESWDDVGRRFPGILAAQPEWLAAAILAEQFGAVRAGVEELRERIREAARLREAREWGACLERLDEVTKNRLHLHLPAALRSELLELACVAAFQAEDWERFDRWAATLERDYQVKDVLPRVLARAPREGA